MTFLVKQSITVKKTPLIQAKEGEAAGEHVIEMPPESHARQVAGLLLYGLVVLCTLAMCIFALSLYIYRQFIEPSSLNRYKGYCTIPMETKSPYYEYQLRSLEWATMPGTADSLKMEAEETLREAFEVADTLEKISVMDNGRKVSFIHDFDVNITGIVDTDRCFSMELDRSVVVPPDTLVVSIAAGEQFDISRVRSAVRAALPALSRAASRALALACAGKPIYSLAKDDSVVIRKRAADAPSHDYIQFAGRHVQEIEITNLAELLQLEQDSRRA